MLESVTAQVLAAPDMAAWLLGYKTQQRDFFFAKRFVYFKGYLSMFCEIDKQHNGGPENRGWAHGLSICCICSEASVVKILREARMVAMVIFQF